MSDFLALGKWTPLTCDHDGYAGNLEHFTFFYHRLNDQLNLLTSSIYHCPSILIVLAALIMFMLSLQLAALTAPRKMQTAPQFLKDSPNQNFSFQASSVEDRVQARNQSFSRQLNFRRTARDSKSMQDLQMPSSRVRDIMHLRM